EAAARSFWLNCGNFLEPGKRRISTRAWIRCWASRARNRSSGCVECPIVKSFVFEGMVRSLGLLYRGTQNGGLLGALLPRRVLLDLETRLFQEEGRLFEAIQTCLDVLQLLGQEDPGLDLARQALTECLECIGGSQQRLPGLGANF